MLRALIHSGHLVLVRHGVYATTAALDGLAEDQRRAHCLEIAAARCMFGPSTVGSHHSAAFIHGIEMLAGPPAGFITMTRPSGTRSGGRGINFHTAELPIEHLAKTDSVVVTCPARTVIDIARTCSFMEAVVAADSALHQSLTSKARLRDVLATCFKWPGSQRASRVVDFCDGRAESVMESCARVLFHAHGLEPPELQTVIRDRHGQFIGRVDFYWPQRVTVAEADGLTKYAVKADILSQFRRDRLLQRAGRKVVHFTWRELFDETTSLITHIRNTLTAPPPPCA